MTTSSPTRTKRTREEAEDDPFALYPPETKEVLEMVKCERLDLLSAKFEGKQIDAHTLNTVTDMFRYLNPSLEMMRYLHREKGMRLYIGKLYLMVEEGRVDIVEWVCDGGEAVVDDRRGMMPPWEAANSLAGCAMEYHKKEVWDWMWKHCKAYRESQTEEVFRQAMRGAIHTALECGFSTAFCDIVKYLGEDNVPACKEEAELLWGNATMGNDYECFDCLWELCQKKGFEPNEDTVQKQDGRAIKHNKMRSYLWFHRLFASKMVRPSVRQVTALFIHAGNSPEDRAHVTFFTYLMNVWPALAKLLREHEEGRGINEIGSIRRMLIDTKNPEIFTRLVELECFGCTPEEFANVVERVRPAWWKPGDTESWEAKMMRAVGKAAGFNDPSTWKDDTPVDGWF